MQYLLPEANIIAVWGRNTLKLILSLVFHTIDIGARRLFCRTNPLTAGHLLSIVHVLLNANRPTVRGSCARLRNTIHLAVLILFFSGQVVLFWFLCS
jgi:hypothetical protein